MGKFIAALILLLAVAPADVAQEPSAPPQVVPAINEVEAWQQVGEQPYELAWVEREQNPHTLVDFEDMKGWTLQLYDGADGELRRLDEEIALDKKYKDDQTLLARLRKQYPSKLRTRLA